MKTSIRRATLAVLRLLADPKREEHWTCPDCGTSNGTGRARCMNGCGTDGPLAPRPAGGT